MEELVFQHLAVNKQLLDELDVHSDCVIQYLY